MGKARRKAERAERRRLKLLQGGGEGGQAAERKSPDAVPLEGRPEYEAHMAAWRAAGEPPGPGAS
jgi:hypothetical protein